MRLFGLIVIVLKLLSEHDCHVYITVNYEYDQCSVLCVCTQESSFIPSAKY